MEIKKDTSARFHGMTVIRHCRNDREFVSVFFPEKVNALELDLEMMHEFCSVLTELSR